MSRDGKGHVRTASRCRPRPESPHLQEPALPAPDRQKAQLRLCWAPERPGFQCREVGCRRPEHRSGLCGAGCWRGRRIEKIPENHTSVSRNADVQGVWIRAGEKPPRYRASRWEQALCALDGRSVVLGNTRKHGEHWEHWEHWEHRERWG